MGRFLLRRLVGTVPLLFLLSLLVFGLMRLIPGDYLSEMQLNPAIPSRQVERMREAWGLDRPIVEQYFHWLKGLASGDLGYSFAQRRPAADLVRERTLVTLALAATSLAMALVASFPLGIAAALRPNSLLERVLLLISVAGFSVPSLLSSVLVLAAAHRFGWLEVTLAGNLLPAAAVLAFPAACLLMRTLRVELRRELGRPYVLAAAARGLPPHRVVRHALRNALNPIISLLGLTLGGLLSGSIVVEKVFGISGLGSLAVDSILGRDLYVALICVLVAAVSVVTANLLADLLLAINDRRVRWDAKA
jgi:peptide/nickel transport system permease protein